MPAPRPLTQSDRRHGTPHGYNYYGCRCDGCRAWNAADCRRRRDLRLRRPIPATAVHGLATTYATYACRCDACRKAHAAYNRAQRLWSRERRARVRERQAATS